MADKKPVKAKRVVKNPETFRERAIKANEVSDKPKRTAKVRQAGSKVANPVIKPIKQAAGKLLKLKPLRPLFKLLGFIGKIILPPYIRNSWSELRQVTWPTKKQSRQLTGAVLIFAAIFGATVALVDFVLDKIFKNLLLS